MDHDIFKFLKNCGPDLADRYEEIANKKVGVDLTAAFRPGLSLPELVNEHLKVLDQDLAKEFQERYLLYVKLQKRPSAAKPAITQPQKPGNRPVGRPRQHPDKEISGGAALTASQTVRDPGSDVSETGASQSQETKVGRGRPAPMTRRSDGQRKRRERERTRSVGVPKKRRGRKSVVLKPLPAPAPPSPVPMESAPEPEREAFSSNQSEDKEAGNGVSAGPAKARPGRPFGRARAKKTYKWKCAHCPFNSISPSLLDIHLQGHDGKGPRKCDICSFSTTANSLKSHMRMHTDAEAAAKKLTEQASSTPDAQPPVPEGSEQDEAPAVEEAVSG